VVETPMMRTVAADDRARRAFLAAQPGGRFGTPEEIGEAAAWLLSDAAAFVTGVAMAVDGGMTG
jgi:NAD(P)-dependent dehydrogenase (short-subunit alcohol dehydrogenase family)